MTAKRIAWVKIALLSITVVLTAFMLTACFGTHTVITFESNGGSPCESVTVEEGTESITLPTPTRNGYNFIGWYSDRAMTVSVANVLSGEDIPDSSVTFYAKWEIKKITLTFKAGEETVEIMSVDYDTYISTEDFPSLDNYPGYYWNTPAFRAQYDRTVEAVKNVEENPDYTVTYFIPSENGFEVEVGTPNKFVPKDNISVKALPGIVEMLKTNAESNRQKVIPLSLMFEDTDKKVANKKKSIPSSAEVLEIPIGARGGEVQDLLLKTTGDGSAHAVVIGGTGSGKSNLLHAIIMSACYKYSPDELNLYLVDFKGGVEFKYYEANKDRKKQLPHIKLTGLTSDLNDGVAILDNLQKELRRREDEFRTNRVEDIVQYRNLGKKMPRLFVIIDEIQELFEQDENLGRKAINIMRELFKKGRAFGINILWASQNSPKVPGLRDQVLSQIGNRISLRLNEPQDAEEIKIDPKVVKNLNRPEKGLGVINDIRYGNESIEFRVAFAETSENRQKYSAKIIDKWKSVAENSEIARGRRKRKKSGRAALFGRDQPARARIGLHS